MNPAAMAPQRAPTIAAGRTLRRCVEALRFTWNAVSKEGETAPKYPPGFMMDSWNDSKNLSVNIAVMHAKNVTTAREGRQWLATSSYAKRRPPMGAPNAVATPHAAPAVMKSRLSLSFRNLRKPIHPSLKAHGVVIPSVALSPCDRPAPIIAPRWIIGPSGPTGNPLALLQMVLMNFTKKTLREKTFRDVAPVQVGHHLGDAAAAGFGGTKRHRVRRGNANALEYTVLNNHARKTSRRFRRCRSVAYFRSSSVCMMVYSTRAIRPTARPTKKRSHLVVAPVNGLPPEPLAVHRAVAGVVLERLDLRLLRRARIGAEDPDERRRGLCEAAAAQTRVGAPTKPARPVPSRETSEANGPVLLGGG